MSHLRQGVVDLATERVDIGKLLLLAKSQCSDREPVPVATIPDDKLVVRANRDRLLSGLSHAIRNAQDACEKKGSVSIGFQVENGICCIKITDDGCGMEPEFIRDRLFRPFDSTKGAEGMGIGAYQIRETVRASGGDVEVLSEVGVGTTMTLCLPLVSGDNT